MSNPLEAYQRIRKEILDTGRKIKLIAVSKTKPQSAVLEYWELGHSVFGENKIQEGIEKFSTLREKYKIELHHLGPFQSGTAKKLFGNFDYTHGLSSIHQVESLLRMGEKYKHTLGYFLQVNLSNEDTKNGFSEKELLESLPKIQSYQNEFVRFSGLMTMGPSSEDPRETRDAFRRLQNIRKEFCPEHSLSMGMSGDYKIALEEGTDILRIGSILFGSR